MQGGPPFRPGYLPHRPAEDHNVAMFNPYTGLGVTQTWAEHVENGGSPGVDFGADSGTPIIAPCSGILHFFSNGSAGWDTVIHQPDGSSERACHCSDSALARSLNLSFVTEGQHVSFSGNTGNVDPFPAPGDTVTGAHIHCNGWRADGVRIPPFGQDAAGASLALAGLAAQRRRFHGEEITMYWRHTNGLVAAHDPTRGVYRYLGGWELAGLLEEESSGRVVVHPLGSPQWEDTFAALTLIGTTRDTLDDSDLDALAEKLAATRPTVEQIVAGILSTVDAADRTDDATLQAVLAALIARSGRLPKNVRANLADAISR